LPSRLATHSGAKIIRLANAGADTINAIKTAAEFHIGPATGQRLAAFVLAPTDVNALRLQAAQGILVTDAFYWDLNDETRAWSKRFFDRVGRMPRAVPAADYSATLHYLKALQAAGTDKAEPVMAKIRALPVHDFFARDGRIRVDGRMVHDMYLMEVKKPEEQRYPWDYYRVLATIPGDVAFPPLSESRCALAHE
jgi:branched-chain amino acid transport system substrate-binding protein